MDKTPHTVCITVEDGGKAEHLLHTLSNPTDQRTFGIISMGCDCAHDDEPYFGTIATLIMGAMLGVVLVILVIAVYASRAM